MAEPRRTGRPRIDPNDPTVHVGLSLPSKQYAELCARALHDEVSVPEIIRRDLRERKNLKTREVMDIPAQ